MGQRSIVEIAGDGGVAEVAVHGNEVAIMVCSCRQPERIEGIIGRRHSYSQPAYSQFAVGGVETSPCKVGNDKSRIGIVGKLTTEQIQCGWSKMPDVGSELCRSIAGQCVQRAFDSSNYIFIIDVENTLV